MNIFGLTFTGNIDGTTFILMLSNFFVAIPATLAYLQSRSNTKGIRAAKSQLDATTTKVDETHIEIKRNTEATVEVAKSVNGKLDAALASAAAAATANAVAAHVETDKIMAKLSEPPV